MRNFFFTNKGQASMSEYVTVFFLIVAAISAMSIYFRRTIQARIFAARNKMVQDAASRTVNVYNGAFLLEYEPYYVNRVGTRFDSVDTEKKLLQGVPGGAGIFRKDIDEYRSTITFSETAPPRNVDIDLLNYNN